jgi:hypothetical protein
MNVFLKFMVGLTCAAVLAYVGYFFYGERQATIEAKRQQEIADRLRDQRIEREQARKAAIAAERSRLEAISEFGCIRSANAAVEALDDGSSVDSEARSDLKICAKYRLITNYQISRLLDVGVLDPKDPVLSEEDAAKQIEAAGVSLL